MGNGDGGTLLRTYRKYYYAKNQDEFYRSYHMNCEDSKWFYPLYGRGERIAQRWYCSEFPMSMEKEKNVSSK